MKNFLLPLEILHDYGLKAFAFDSGRYIIAATLFAALVWVMYYPRWWLKTPLTDWISTTTHHDMHHSGSFKRDHGFYFRFWGRLMGTEHPKYIETFERVVTPAQSVKFSGTVLPTPL